MKRARLLSLLTERSFQRKRVVLASGKESDFFIDCKQTVLTAEGHALVGELMFEALEKLPRFARASLSTSVLRLRVLRGDGRPNLQLMQPTRT